MSVKSQGLLHKNDQYLHKCHRSISIINNNIHNQLHLISCFIVSTRSAKQKIYNIKDGSITTFVFTPIYSIITVKLQLYVIVQDYIQSR